MALEDRQLQNILLSGGISNIFLSGVTPDDKVIKKADLADLETKSDDLIAPKYGVINPDVDIITLNVDTTKFNVAAFNYYIDGLKYTFAGGAFNSGFGQAGDFIDIGVDSSGLRFKLNSFFTPVELETILEIGRIATADGTNITSIGDSVFFTDEFMRALYVRHKSFEGTLFAGDAGKITVSANPFQLNVAAGDINTADISVKSITAEVALAAFPVYSISGTTAIRTLQDPLVVQNTQYDNGTDLVNIPTGKFVAHTLFRSSGTSRYYLEYGRNVYEDEANAVDGELTNVLFDIPGADVEPLAKIIVQEGATDITRIVDLRNGANREEDISTLQAVYNRSDKPQIRLLDDNPLEIKNSVGDTNDILLSCKSNDEATTYLELTKTGFIHKPGWKDNIAALTIGTTTGVSEPDFIPFVGNIHQWAFAPNGTEEIFVNWHINHDYKLNTPIFPHIHWSPSTANSGVVRWGVELTVAKGHSQEAFITTQTVYLEQEAGGDHLHQVNEGLVGILGSGELEPDTVICARIFRDGTNINDTYPDDAFGLTADLHYQSDREDTPQKAPDFYVE